MISYPFESSPTIKERILQGLATNSTDDAGIIPFREEWDESTIDVTCTTGARYMLADLRSQGWRVSNIWFYRDADGSRISAAMRLDHPDKGKQVLPVRASRAVGINPNAEIKALEQPRPLYNLHLLSRRPKAPVLMVEGEKAADAGCALFPTYVTTTWSGGAGGVAATDLRPLTGRDVVIWPDHDEDGLGAVDKLGPLLAAVGAASVRVVRVPASFPKKWDIADQVPDVADD